MAKKPPEGEKVLYTNRRFRVLRVVRNVAPPRHPKLLTVSYRLETQSQTGRWFPLEGYDYFRNARNRAKAASEAIDTSPFRSKRKPDLKSQPNRPGSRPL